MYLLYITRFNLLAFILVFCTLYGGKGVVVAPTVLLISWRSYSPLHIIVLLLFPTGPKYRDADKSFARPGSKQATATEDFEFHLAY